MVYIFIFIFKFLHFVLSLSQFVNIIWVTDMWKILMYYPAFILVARWIKVPKFGLTKGCLVWVFVSTANKCDVTPHLRISDTDIWVRSRRSGWVQCFPHLQEYWSSTDEDLIVYCTGIISNVCSCVQFYTGVFIVCSRNLCCYHGFLL